jgi:hypothetical protein
MIWLLLRLCILLGSFAFLDESFRLFGLFLYPLDYIIATVFSILCILKSLSSLYPFKFGPEDSLDGSFRLFLDLLGIFSIFFGLFWDPLDMWFLHSILWIVWILKLRASGPPLDYCGVF